MKVSIINKNKNATQHGGKFQPILAMLITWLLFILMIFFITIFILELSPTCEKVTWTIGLGPAFYIILFLFIAGFIVSRFFWLTGILTDIEDKSQTYFPLSALSLATFITFGFSLITLLTYGSKFIDYFKHKEDQNSINPTIPIPVPQAQK
tara:strand:- start:5989 stop:6441 length:453 start_codon:yes stop_codon:yes gene_type:complete